MKTHLTKLVLVSCGFISCTALARVTETSQNITPNGGESSLLIGAVGTSMNGKVGLNNTAASASGYSIPFEYYFGLNDSNALGLEANYSSFNTNQKVSGISYTGKQEGVSDVNLAYATNIDLGLSTFYAKLRVGFPLQSQKTNYQLTSYTMSTSSGQMSASLDAGFIFPTRYVNLGLGFGLQGRQDGDEEYTYNGLVYNGKAKGGGESSYTIFAEIPNIYHPGIELNYTRNYASSFTSNGGAVNQLYDGNEKWLIDLNMRYDVTDYFEILPTVGYSNYVDLTKTAYSSYDQYLYGLALRLFF